MFAFCSFAGVIAVVMEVADAEKVLFENANTHRIYSKSECPANAGR